MLRRVLTKTLMRTPIAIRSYTNLTFTRTAMITRPIFEPSMLVSLRPRYFAEASKHIIDLEKEEDWDKYANKMSNEKPVIVEFFAKYP